MGTNHSAVEHLHECRRRAGFREELEKHLEHPGVAQSPEPLPDAVPIAEFSRKRPPGDVMHGEIMQCLQKLTVVPTGLTPTRPRRSETLSVIDQSSSVIPVSMAGSLLPDTHRFEERVIREYPGQLLQAIRPHGLGQQL